MSSEKQSKKKSQQLSFDSMVKCLRSTMAGFPDIRTGSNCHYSIEDAALGAFSIFFTQSPSFLAFQSDMQKNKGISNAQTLFNMDEIPSDNHIRNLMDEVPPSEAYPMFHYVFDGIKVISLPPEFITPQDGHQKQDCENAAAKRWIKQYAPLYCRPKNCQFHASLKPQSNPFPTMISQPFGCGKSVEIPFRPE